MQNEEQIQERSGNQSEIVQAQSQTDSLASACCACTITCLTPRHLAVNYLTTVRYLLEVGYEYLPWSVFPLLLGANTGT